MSSGWRMILIRSKASISYSLGNIIIENNDGICELPIIELKVVIIESLFLILKIQKTMR